MTTEEQIEELRRRIAELERGNSPTPPPSAEFKRINHLDRLAMPGDAIRAMTDAVGDSLMRDIVNDSRSRPSSTSLAEQEEARPPLSVSVERPLAPPSGVAQCDRLLDQQDALDRKELERKLRK